MKKGSGNRSGSETREEPLSSDLLLVRTLDRTLKSRYPDGVSLMSTLEGGKVMELHRRIRQTFDPHACSKASELTSYLWSIGRPVSLEPGGGITIRTARSVDKSVIGRAFYRDCEAEYRILHAMILEALGAKP